MTTQDSRWGIYLNIGSTAYYETCLIVNFPNYFRYIDAENIPLLTPSTKNEVVQDQLDTGFDTVMEVWCNIILILLRKLEVFKKIF